MRTALGYSFRSNYHFASAQLNLYQGGNYITYPFTLKCPSPREHPLGVSGCGEIKAHLEPCPVLDTGLIQDEGAFYLVV